MGRVNAEILPHSFPARLTLLSINIILLRPTKQPSHSTWGELENSACSCLACTGFAFIQADDSGKLN